MITPTNMELTFVVAKVFAIYLFISGWFLLLRRKTLTHVLRDFFEHPAIVHFAGVFLIFLGGTLVVSYAAWREDARTLITVFGALALLKGTAYLFFSKQLSRIHIDRSRPAVAIWGIVAIALGVYLFQLQ